MTDLEPDDVLALKIIFQEANAIYDRKGKYPIELIIVGEGNNSIKRMRMEKMLQEMLKVPEEVSIKVVEGKSTSDNLFPYDGEELFTKEELAHVKEGKDGSEAAAALKNFVEVSSNPLILQIKPAQELLDLSQDAELAQKTTLFFYGSFNFRKTLKDEAVLKNPVFENVRESPIPEQLQVLLDHFTSQFQSVGILESYGILGDESAVFYEYPWTEGIAERIQNADDPFMEMFKILIKNWNRYLLLDELPIIQTLMKTLHKLV